MTLADFDSVFNSPNDRDQRPTDGQERSARPLLVPGKPSEMRTNLSDQSMHAPVEISSTKGMYPTSARPEPRGVPALTPSAMFIKEEEAKVEEPAKEEAKVEEPTVAAQAEEPEEETKFEELKVEAPSLLSTSEPLALKDNTFYFSSLFVQLSDETVTIPRQPLYQKSSAVRSLLATKNFLAGSTTKENPLKLEWTSRDEFGIFMDVLLGYSTGSLTSDKWICVLKVADRLQVSDLRDLAISNLAVAVLPHHAILGLAREYRIFGNQWRRLSYEEIALAPKLPTVSEAEAIGWNWTLRLADLREKRLFNNVHFYHRPAQPSKISRFTRNLLLLKLKAFAYCRKYNLTEDIYPNSAVEYPPVFQRAALDNAYEKVFGSEDNPTTNDGDRPERLLGHSSSPRQSSSNRAFNVSYLVLKVDQTLFRVPRDIFEEQEQTSRFMERYNITDNVGSEEQPVVLDDVSVVDFKSFLKCATNTSADREQKEVWVAAIKLSRMWHLDRPRHTAIAKLDAMKLDSVTQAELARTCDIDNWLRPAMLKLALQQAPPSESNVKHIGYENAMRLLQLREEIVYERHRVLHALLLKDMEEKRNDPRNMKCRFCGTHFEPDVYCVDLKEEQIIMMVRTLVAGEFFEGEEMKADEREKVNLNVHVSRKHLTRQGAAVSPPLPDAILGVSSRKKAPNRG